MVVFFTPLQESRDVPGQPASEGREDFPGSRLSTDALFLPVALCHADSVHRAHILPGSSVAECLPGSGGMVLPVVVLLNPAESGACSRIQAGTGPVRGVPELCAGLMQRAYGAARLPPPQRDRLMVHRVCIGAETGQ